MNSAFPPVRSALKIKRPWGRLRDVLLIACGVGSAGLGLKGFLIPNHFIDGGVTGLSMLLSKSIGLPLALLILLINAPFFLAGYKLVARSFALKSLLAVLGLAVLLFTTEFPTITDDKLLTAVFGGFFLGAGIRLSIRGGCVLDGTEILALLVSKRTSLTIGDVILVINLVLFMGAAFLLGAEPAMYSVLTYLTASKTIDFIIHGIEEYTGVTIVSVHSVTIRQAILTQLGRAVTIYKGQRGFSGDEVDILYCVVTRLEVQRLKTLIAELDPTAFLIMHSINDTSGGMIKKRPLSH
ncbi:YitT family protein [Rufibacter psychrotolerans]|uniref:YitT family protein n=1 Tax=Rufibacter psychrotolerans TaxID=2812556 RepID=UPI001F080DFD|nr:YitT family protein [Rufibacter sp. SYSU D00308]